MSYETKAYSVSSPTAAFVPDTIKRREPKERDVQIEVLFCGICHSDLHTARDEWHAFMPTQYPCVPGHEIVGRVAAVGSGVTRHKKGDIVAVGCQVDTDRTCPMCAAKKEQFCPGQTGTYNFPDKHLGGHTYGGYSESVVVDEGCVFSVPESLHSNLAGVAPLVCAGITTYSPLRHWKAGPGKRVGVAGLGGLGHMAIKLARAMGAHVVSFTRSADKGADALRLGAHEFVLTGDAEAMKKNLNTCDLIIDTISADHDINSLLALLGVDGTLVLVGAPPKPMQIVAFSLIMGRRSLAGSLIGGLGETQEMLDFCGQHKIWADVEVVAPTKLNEVYERLAKSDVKYRFSIDIKAK